MNNTPKLNLSQSNPFSKEFLSFGKTLNPKRDWKILLTFFLILLVASVYFDYYMYNNVASGDMYVRINKQELTVEKLKSVELSKIVDTFETKKEILKIVKVENLIDPSL